MKYDCMIIGGGASGLMLAAMLNVNKGIMVESTDVLGSKLLLTGGGRCNITHDGSIKDFVPLYGAAGRTLRKCLYRHNNIEYVEWIESIGVPTVVEDERYYPETMKAVTVRDALVDQARKNGWEIRTGSKVTDIERDEAGWYVRAGRERLLTENIVIATGGITFPKTGSDGSMFEVIRDLGIDVTPVRPALAPVHVRNYPYGELSGISVPNVTVTAFSSDAAYTCKGKAARLTGDLLFMHDGFSGPVIMNISRYCEPGEMIKINYNCRLEELPKRMRRMLEDRARGDSGDIKTSILAGLLESDGFVVDHVDMNGYVTAGGICLAEQDAGTMELKKCPGCFAIGEALDADGPTGGYNLQLCYSTAATAADELRSRLER